MVSKLLAVLSNFHPATICNTHQVLTGYGEHLLRYTHCESHSYTFVHIVVLLKARNLIRT